MSGLCFRIFFCASFGAVIAGAIAAKAAAVPISIVVRNMAAWLVGALLAALIARTSKRGNPLIFIAPTVLCLAGTFLSAGNSGVHRWIMLGTLRFNAAELSLPLAIVILPALAIRHRGALVITALLSVLLAMQPDASQTVAFAVAGVLMLCVLDISRTLRAVSGLFLFFAAGVAVIRPDPLQPVPEVEGIVALAQAASTLLAIAGVIFVALSAAAPIVFVRSTVPEARAASIGLLGYMIIAALAPVFGPFPVPLMGMGVSPIIGAWLGIGLLTHITNHRTSAA